jgi:hypothetical protein
VAYEEKNMLLELLREIMQDGYFIHHEPPRSLCDMTFFFVVSIGRLFFGFASPLPTLLHLSYRPDLRMLLREKNVVRTGTTPADL